MSLPSDIVTFFHIPVTASDWAVVLGVFFCFSVIGWCVESLYISFLNKKWTNRGFLHATLCPIYGFAEFFGYRLLLLLGNNYIIIFIVGVVFATALELMVAKLMIIKFGAVWWDYTKRPFNYKGILSLESSLAWGVYAVCEMWFIHDGLEHILGLIPYQVLLGVDIALIVYCIADLIYVTRKVNSEGITAEENNMLKVR